MAETAQLKFTVSNQEIIRTDSFVAVEGSDQYLYAQFTFETSDWDGLYKTGVFIDEDGTVHPSLCTDNVCPVPPAWLVKQKGAVGVLGSDGVTKITTKAATVRIQSKGYEGEAVDEDEAASYFDQIIAAFSEGAKSTAEYELSAEAWAHGHADYPDRDTDNAKYYAGQAKGSADTATAAKNTAIENANISTNKAEETEADRAEVAQNKSDIVQLKADTEQIRQDTLAAEQRVIQLMSTDTKSYFFATLAERDAATGIRNCDRCSVYETRADYIYDTENVDGDETNPEWVKTSDWDALKTVAWDIITGKPDFAAVALSGKYSDLIGIPNRYNSPIVLDGTTDTVTWDYSLSDTAIVTLAEEKTLSITNSYNGCRATLDVYGYKLTLDDENYLKSTTYAYLEAVEGEHYHYEFQKIADKWQVGMTVMAGAESEETE